MTEQSKMFDDNNVVTRISFLNFRLSKRLAGSNLDKPIVRNQCHEVNPASSRFLWLRSLWARLVGDGYSR